MKFVKQLLAAAACAVLPLAAAAQAAFPSRPVTIIVPNAPGGAIDILARLLERNLSGTWKQPVIVQYKPGAGTVLGTDFVAKAPADGHTIGLVITGHMINPSLRKAMPYDTLKDLAGVSLLASSPVVITASSKLPAGNLKDLIALAKNGKLSYASPGSGSSMHLGAELLKTTAGIDILHTPYKGAGGAYPDVIAGRVDLLVDPLFSSLPHIKSGGLKPIAIMSPKRSPIAPEIPTVAETLPGFSVESVFGAVVPAATPRDVVHKISADMNKALQTPEVKQRMADIGLTPMGNTPEQFDAFIRAEIPKWARVVKASGATAD
ncbi:MAG: tripartite tricarboxylate transporter substrate binding protein [Ramlibacter sp.]|jgi:tripartite-type tricarboxylate transporter receptor subunit TctC|uniref:tripartite tricarboxylate transporter substrate binding protein n=1 Tax=Ramlibacter sp. TaxID=1917967 RepID=UPI0026384B47|nr:tripartite tricarboxylate transporter substrate binding protein [Ramlibacter sp.]MDB5750970.1 tripartite tricarboxylate transporter substrate binding protein [Ramlibacter sp.]